MALTRAQRALNLIVAVNAPAEASDLPASIQTQFTALVNAWNTLNAAQRKQFVYQAAYAARRSSMWHWSVVAARTVVASKLTALQSVRTSGRAAILAAVEGADRQAAIAAAETAVASAQTDVTAAEAALALALTAHPSPDAP